MDRRLALVLAVLAAVALAAAPAAAQELNPQAFPVGEEALGLGGAYTGRAADASASFYGPGGLVFGREGSVSASLSIGLYDRYTLDGATDAYALEFEDALGVPVYVGASMQLGDENPDGSHRHALAAATFSPSHGQRAFTLERGVDGGAVEALSVRRRDRTRFYGVSYALRVLDELGVGVSAFFAIRSFTHQETEIVSDGETVSSRHSRVTLDAEALVFRIGAHWRAERHVSIGLMFQPPGIEVGARGTVASVIGTGGAAGGDTSFGLEEKIGARSPVPWQLRLGGAWTPLESVLLTADVSLVGPVGSEADPIMRFRPNEPAAEGDFGRYVATRYWSDWRVDGAIGGRVVVEDVVPISAGIFTSLSSAPAIPEGPTSVYQPDRIDLIGASLSVGVRGDSYDFALGVVGTLGWGQGLRAAPLSGLAPPTYVAADLDSQAIYVFVSGAGGAIRAVTRELFGEEATGRERAEDAEDTENAERD